MWNNSIWSDNSPDMNSAENISTIIKEKVEELMASNDRHKNAVMVFWKVTLRMHLGMLKMTDLFIDSLYSMGKRFGALKTARRGHIIFCNFVLHTYSWEIYISNQLKSL